MHLLRFVFISRCWFCLHQNCALKKRLLSSETWEGFQYHRSYSHFLDSPIALRRTQKSVHSSRGHNHNNSNKQRERGIHQIHLVLKDTKNIRVTSIHNADSRSGEVLSASSAEVVAVSLIVVDSGLREHSIILNLRLSQRRTVGSHKNQLR